MGRNLKDALILSIAFALVLPAIALAGEAQKAAAGGFQTVLNKSCGYWIRYPKGSTLGHPSDCALQITLPQPGEKWISEESLTLYTAPLGQDEFGEKPDPASTPDGFLVAGGIKFSKTVFLDAGMSHRWVTVFYEAEGKKHRYRLKGYLNSVVPEVMDLHLPHWDPQGSAEKIFNGMVSNFRPLE